MINLDNHRLDEQELDKIKKILLCKGQIIGEDLLLEKLKTLSPLTQE